MQLLLGLLELMKVLLLCITLLSIGVMFITRRQFENAVKSRLGGIVTRKYTSRKQLEKDIASVYEMYEEEKRKRGWESSYDRKK